MKIWPGLPRPLGASYDGAGTNFSIFSSIAERVELCLFDEEGRETRIEMQEISGYCWHAYLPTIGPGQRYGYRIHGPWNPSSGQRCNPNKLLLDPYAKSVDGGIQWDEALFPYKFPEGPDSFSETDSGPFMPKSVVHQPHFNWDGDRQLKLQWHETVIYEMHVKGFTEKHPDIPEELRGTYAGLAHPVAINYLKELGISSVELMPTHQFVHDKHLIDKGLRNYWGYNSIGFFAPHNEYAADKRPGAEVAEFKQMVKNLHRAGIEVILDVVYNHTAEGNHMGPMLCFKGIDNAYYYRTMPDARYYMDYTGTGNTLNMRSPHVLQMVMDSLRYWILEMHVDGFRFDLASTLARSLHEVDRLSTFFNLIQQDPVVSQAKLIAEPWDIGEGGYQVGNFPPGWTEWNGKYRDCVRDFWRCDKQTVGEFASRITGSSDLYQDTTRLPFASINFITAHDGFTLNDLVSYNDKHNEANGEGGADGENHNRSWNCGAEGPTEDTEILKLRARQQRNMLATLLLSQGVPMLLGGDEMGRTQGGNNNAYCQDNEITWIDWKGIDKDLLDYSRHLIKFRREHPVFRRRKWFHSSPIFGNAMHEIAWFAPSGEPMTEANWNNASGSIGVFLNGDRIPNPNPLGDAVTDDSFYIIFNSHYEPSSFKLPGEEWGNEWFLKLDTRTGWVEEKIEFKPGSEIEVMERSIILLCKPKKTAEDKSEAPAEGNENRENKSNGNNGNGNGNGHGAKEIPIGSAETSVEQ